MSPASTTPRLQSERTARRARRYRSCGFHLQARTASRTPGEERTLERFRTPSVVYGPDALITRRPFISWRLVKDATKRLRTGSPSLVPPRAFNARSTSLGLDTRDFARASRCVRPTSAYHCLPTLYPRSWFPTRLVHSRKNGAIGGSVVSRRAGSASAGRAATRRVFFTLTPGRSCLLGRRSQNAVSLHSRLCL